LIGAPPGYVGYDESGQLTEAVRRKPYSVVLLDEIEKAHPDVFNILLQVLDDGRLTDNKGRLVDFKNTIIIMTSNMGSHIIQEAMNNGKSETDMDGVHRQVMELLRKSIRPEFLNRIDEVVMFKPLNEDEIKGIVRIQLQMLQKMLKKNQVDLDMTEEAITYISNHSYDPQFGARPVKRFMQRHVLNELSKMILSGKVNKDKTIIIDSRNGELVFEN
jgi:ATP-dependent Clp protease ATP-binding subunit ClpB